MKEDQTIKITLWKTPLKSFEVYPSIKLRQTDWLILLQCTQTLDTNKQLFSQDFSKRAQSDNESRGRRGRWFEGQLKRHRYLWHRRDGVSVIIWRLNRSTQSRAWRRTQMEYWWWLVQEQTTDCTLMESDADIFIQLAQLTVIKENETLRLVCMGRRREKNQEERPQSQLCHLFWSTSEQFHRFYRNTKKKTHTKKKSTVCMHTCSYTHTVDTFLVNRHAHKYLCWTEASFPALLYLMHIKYHFPEKIP